MAPMGNSYLGSVNNQMADVGALHMIGEDENE